MSKKTNLEDPGLRKMQKTVSRNDHSQDISDKLSFLCEIVPYGKNPIPILDDYLASIEKVFILAGLWGTSL